MNKTDILEVLRDYQGTISAIIGALAGMLGTYTLQNIGKTHIEFYDVNFKYIEIEPDCEGGFNVKEAKPLVNRSNTCEYSMDVEIYNGSETPRVLRSIQIQFFREGKMIAKSVPKDYSTRRFVARQEKYDKLQIINIPAKQVIRMHIVGDVNLDGCYDKVYFTAIQNRRKKLRKQIKTA